MRAGHELASWRSFLSEEADLGCASCPRSCSKSSILESHTRSDPRTNASSPPGAKAGLGSAVMCHEPGSCPSRAHPPVLPQSTASSTSLPSADQENQENQMCCPTKALPCEHSWVIHSSPLWFQENLTSSLINLISWLSVS